MAGRLALLLLAREHERVHYGFVLAAGAAAIGTEVTIFATNGALHGLARDWSGLADAGRDAEIRARGVAGLAELREACVSLGVRLLACEAGMIAEGLDAAALLPEVEESGVAGFLAGADGRLLSI